MAHTTKQIAVRSGASIQGQLDTRGPVIHHVDVIHLLDALFSGAVTIVGVTTLGDVEASQIVVNGVVDADSVSTDALEVTGEAIASTFTATGTGALGVPKGTTAQRPAVGQNGMMRFNEELGIMEYYADDKWKEVGSGSGGVDAALVYYLCQI